MRGHRHSGLEEDQKKNRNQVGSDPDILDELADHADFVEHSRCMLNTLVIS